MQGETYFLKGEDIFRFYERIAQEFDLYVPTRIKNATPPKCEYSFNNLPGDNYFLKRYLQVNKEEMVFNDYRTIEPIRAFFTYAKEEVCSYFYEEKAEDNTKPIAISGVKNCDLFSLKIQDFVFLGGNEPDLFYKSRRESALLISSDCVNFKEVCFCRAFDISPYATEGFDFNLSRVNGGYLLDIASDKAKKIIGGLWGLISPATSTQLSERQMNRASVIKQMEDHLAHHQIPKKERLKEIVLAGYDSGIWQEQMLTCVECGGCVFICDTCHCFLLFDEPGVKEAKRLRVWDGCLYPNFARVAGGANPLRMRYMRLRNRYLKKFDFFIENIGFQACCGCGRCIEVCPGRIDIRYILRKLNEEYIQSR